MKDKEFEKHLQKIEDPNYEGWTYVIDKNSASPLEKVKFNLCQKILTYKQDNHLTNEQVAKKIQLSEAEVNILLRCRINEFTLDRLVVYANRLFVNLELSING